MIEMRVRDQNPIWNQLWIPSGNTIWRTCFDNYRVDSYFKGPACIGIPRRWYIIPC